MTDGSNVLHQLIEALPMNGEWPEKERKDWLHAIEAVTDYVMLTRRQRALEERP